MAGHIRCAKCEKAKSKSVCKCGEYKSYVCIYWRGKQYKFRRYVDGQLLDFARAERQLTEMRAEIDKGKFNPANWTKERIKARKFENKIYEWLESKEREMKAGELAPKTYAGYQGYVRNHFDFFKRLDVQEINFEDLTKFKESLLCGLKTKRNLINALHTFFIWMWKRGAIEKLPPFPTVEGDDSKVMQAIDYDTQIEALEKLPAEHRDIFEFEFETGLRPAEVCALKVRDIDLQRGMAIIQRTYSASELRETTKNKRKAFIPLSDRALEVATQNIAGKFGNDFVFINPKTKRGYRVWFLGRLWREKSGLEVTHYEAGRHSFCTRIISLGASELEAQKLMRHSDGRSTRAYYHPTGDHLRDLVNRKSGTAAERKVVNMEGK